MPSDDEVREHLRDNPHLLQEQEVRDALREHPEWDPRTTSDKTEAPDATTEASAPADHDSVDPAAVTSSPDQ